MVCVMGLVSVRVRVRVARVGVFICPSEPTKAKSLRVRMMINHSTLDYHVTNTNQNPNPNHNPYMAITLRHGGNSESAFKNTSICYNFNCRGPL